MSYGYFDFALSGGSVGIVNSNLLANSDDFDSSIWLSVRSDVIAGGELACNSTIGQHYIVHTKAPVNAGNIYTLSCKVKKNTSNWVQLVGSTASFGTDLWANFNINTGNIGNVGTATLAVNISPIDIDGYYRIAITGISTSTVDYFTIAISPMLDDNLSRLPSFNGTGQSIYLENAQLNNGFLADYVSGGQSNIINPNLLLDSRAFDNSVWTKSGLTVSPNSATSPFGDELSDTINNLNTTATHLILYNASTITRNMTYTLSVYAKKNNNDWFQLSGASAPFGINFYANFKISNGTVGNIGSDVLSYKILSAANGYYRLAITGLCINNVSVGTTMVAGAVLGGTDVRVPVYLGDALSTYIDGAKLELGSLTDYVA